MKGFFDDTKEFNLRWFIEESEKIYGIKFDFSKTNYVSIRKDVIITCPLHGDFSVRPFAFIRQKTDCKKCRLVRQAQILQKNLNELNPEYHVYEDSFSGTVKKCKFLHIPTNTVLYKTPSNLICSIRKSIFRKLNKKPRVKKVFVPKVFPKQQCHIVDNSTINKINKGWSISNVECVKSGLKYDTTLAKLKRSINDSCPKCCEEHNLNIKKQLHEKRLQQSLIRTAHNKEVIKNKYRNKIISCATLQIDDVTKKSITLLCANHGYFTVQKSTFNRYCSIRCLDELCSDCYLHKNSIAVKFPTLLIDWDYKKNIVSPTAITKGSSKKIFWSCHRCKNEFQCLVAQKLNLHNGCSFCSIKTSSRIERIIFFFIQEVFGHKNVIHNTYIRGNHKKINCDILIKNIRPKLVIEYDGSYFHKNLLQKDKQKIDSLNKIGIHCLRIRELPLQSLQPHDITYKHIDYNHADFNNHITDLMHKIFNFIKIHFKLSKNVNKSLDAALKKMYDYSLIPKNFFLYPLIGTSMKDFYPQLESYWDLKSNILTLTQIPKSDNILRWWICESCKNSFKKLSKTIIRKLNQNQQIHCKSCRKPLAAYIPKTKLPYTSSKVQYQNGMYIISCNKKSILTELRNMLKLILKCYVISKMEFDANNMVSCNIVRRKMKKGIYQSISEKIIIQKVNICHTTGKVEVIL